MFGILTHLMLYLDIATHHFMWMNNIRYSPAAAVVYLDLGVFSFAEYCCPDADPPPPRLRILEDVEVLPLGNLVIHVFQHGR